MSNFLILMRQNGGCDYTIGCGLAYEIYKADSAEEAFKKWAAANDDLSYYLPGNESALESVEIFEISSANHSDIWPEFVKFKQQKIKTASELAKEAAEKAEYERLRAKFG